MNYRLEKESDWKGEIMVWKRFDANLFRIFQVTEVRDGDKAVFILFYNGI